MGERFIDPTIREPEKTEKKAKTIEILATAMLEKFYERVKKGKKFVGDAYKFYAKPITKGKDDTLSTYADKLYATPIAGSTVEKKEIEKIAETAETVEVIKDGDGEDSFEQKMIIESTEVESEYESIVTKNYFEGWEALEIQGNPNLKDTIKKNIISSEIYHKLYYEQIATELEITVEELKNRLQAKVENLVNTSEFWLATKVYVLDQIMNVDERWKSQFETNESGGALKPIWRAKQEHKIFGIENDAQKNKEERPIYGYLSNNEHGAINLAGTIPPPNNVMHYGEVNVKIKKEIALKKGTITFFDSLSQTDFYPTPASKPHFISVRCYDIKAMLNKGDGTSISNYGEPYTEAQYHGQLRIDDVESIDISINNGLSPEEIERVKSIFNKYKEQHPESTITLIEF